MDKAIITMGSGFESLLFGSLFNTGYIFPFKRIPGEKCTSENEADEKGKVLYFYRSRTHMS